MGNCNIWHMRNKIIKEDVPLETRKKFLNAVIDERLTICKDCEWKNNDRCKACGCLLQQRAGNLTASCGLTNIGEFPKWLPYFSKEDDKKFRDGF